MAQYHANGKISHNAIATFAYNCRAKLKDPSTGKILNYSHKEDLLYSNHFMCENAPKSWSKNAALCWKSVAEREGLIDPRTGKPTQHARKIEFALPKELTKVQQIKICDKLAKFYAKMGMCVSYGIHKTKNGNVHCHMMLTMRKIDEKGKWVEAKNKSVVALDKNGERIPQLDKEKVEQWEQEHGVKFDLDKATQEDKDFCQKVRVRKNKGVEKMWVRDVVNVSGWDSGDFYKKNVRKKIETLCNAGLRLAGSKERVSCLSYAERGIKKIPTIHEGGGKKAAIRAAYNDRVKAYNQKMENWEELQAELFARLKANDVAAPVSKKEETQDTRGKNVLLQNTPQIPDITPERNNNASAETQLPLYLPIFIRKHTITGLYEEPYVGYDNAERRVNCPPKMEFRIKNSDLLVTAINYPEDQIEQQLDHWKKFADKQNEKLFVASEEQEREAQARASAMELVQAKQKQRDKDFGR